MTYQEWLGFEVAVMDQLDTEDIKDEEDLERLADEFHCHLETAFEDWAADKGIEYDRMY